MQIYTQYEVQLIQSLGVDWRQTRGCVSDRGQRSRNHP